MSMPFIVFSSSISHSVPLNVKFQLWSINTTTGSVTSTLPDVTKCSGTCVAICKTDASVNSVTINTVGSQSILGAGGLVLTQVLATQGKSITIVSNGVVWISVATM